MDAFNNDLQNLLTKYPQVEDITYTIREVKTISRGSKVAATVPESTVPASHDEGSILDQEAKAKIDKIKELTKYDGH